MGGRTYTITKERIQGGYYPGFRLNEDGTLAAVSEEPVHCLYLEAIDGGDEDCLWGRLMVKGRFQEHMVCYLYVLALNQDSFRLGGKDIRIDWFLCDSRGSADVKREFLMQEKGLRFVNQKDVVLYGLKGRYLYAALEIVGQGEGCISRMKVDLQGDHFMDTFPEIYRERGGFFHRYLSVFSSIYKDFQEDIEKLPGLLDLDQCPRQLLPVYGTWLGLQVGNDFLEEEILRPLVKEACRLNRMKGTKAALELAARIVLGEPALVLEKNVIENNTEKEQMDEWEKLYGHSACDVTVLVKESVTEAERSRLLFLLDQFKPVGSRLHVVRMRKNSRLDFYSYMDRNARIPEQEPGRLDGGQELGEILWME